MEIGRRFQGEDGRAAFATGEGDAPAQNNAAVSPKQPTALAASERPDEALDWARAAPWVALALVQVIHLGLVLYDESQDWTFLGDLWLIIMIAGIALGILVWLATWTLLADRPLLDRAIYFAVGFSSLAAITAPIINWWQDTNLLVSLAAVMVGCALPLVHLWRRGWRIRIQSRPDTSSLGMTTPLFQFSIGDLLVATTGLSVVLSLLLVGGNPGVPDFTIIGVQVVGGAAVATIGLGWRRFWIAVLTCLLIVGLLCVLGMAIVEPTSLIERASLLMVATYAGPAAASCLVAIGIVRTAGYRLTRV